MEIKNLELIIKKWALKNAIEHNGKASWKHVIPKVIAEVPEIKSKVKEIIPLVQKICEEVNNLSISQQKEELQKLAPELLEKKKEVKYELDPLPGAIEGKVVLRFAPNPDGAIHLGNARAAILSDEYAKRYKGKFILRFEDTDPKVKKPLAEAYGWIIEDLEWLGCKIHEIHYQSLRLEIYYDLIRKLIEKGHAYVCLCSQEKIKELRQKGEACEHRNQDPSKNLELFDQMLEGRFKEGEAVVRIKTDIKHPNPSVRDWIAFRIVDNPEHPIVGNKYIVWPTFNFANAVDDHLMGVTHVLRMKEHIVNQMKQEYIFKYFGWKKPIYCEFGAIVIEGLEFHKSAIKKGILEGKYSGWDDHRLATLRALRRRGIPPEIIREYILSLGLKPSKATVNWGLIYSKIKERYDKEIPRYFFVANPKKIIVELKEVKLVKVWKHPTNKDLGYKIYHFVPGKHVFWIDEQDFNNLEEGKVFRLKEFANLEVVKKEEDTIYAKLAEDQSIRREIPKIQWIYDKEKIKCKVYLLDRIEEGFVEYKILFEKREIVQFERKYNVKIETRKPEIIECIYSFE